MAKNTLEVSQDYYLKGDGYSGHLALHKEKLVKNGKNVSSAFEELTDSEKQAYQTYLGYPLLNGKSFWAHWKLV